MVMRVYEPGWLVKRAHEDDAPRQTGAVFAARSTSALAAQLVLTFEARQHLYPNGIGKQKA